MLRKRLLPLYFPQPLGSTYSPPGDQRKREEWTDTHAGPLLREQRVGRALLEGRSQKLLTPLLGWVLSWGGTYKWTRAVEDQSVKGKVKVPAGKGIAAGGNCRTRGEIQKSAWSVPSEKILGAVFIFVKPRLGPSPFRHESRYCYEV
jgi:hypothetical protein